MDDWFSLAPHAHRLTRARFNGHHRVQERCQVHHARSEVRVRCRLKHLLCFLSLVLPNCCARSRANRSAHGICPSFDNTQVILDIKERNTLQKRRPKHSDALQVTSHFSPQKKGRGTKFASCQSRWSCWNPSSHSSLGGLPLSSVVVLGKLLAQLVLGHVENSGILSSIQLSFLDIEPYTPKSPNHVPWHCTLSGMFLPHALVSCGQHRPTQLVCRELL